MSSLSWMAAVVALLAIGLAAVVLPSRQLRVPAHMHGSAFYEKQLLSVDAGISLLNLMKRMQDLCARLSVPSSALLHLPARAPTKRVARATFSLHVCRPNVWRALRAQPDQR